MVATVDREENPALTDFAAGDRWKEEKERVPLPQLCAIKGHLRSSNMSLLEPTRGTKGSKCIIYHPKFTFSRINYIIAVKAL